MKEILISIKPYWVKKILKGEKTIEIRKTKPKCELPCKVYIYCTKEKELTMFNGNNLFGYSLNGKVVAEFTLNKVKKFDYEGLKFYGVFEDVLKYSCLTDEELCNYIQDGIGYGWKIDNLIIYDKPKELSEFICRKPLKRPPQSWCYCERKV